MIRGAGTVLNMATIVVGSGLGVLLGGRLPERTRSAVTDALGLVTLVIGGLSLGGLSSPALRSVVGHDGPLLVVLGALLIGGIAGSLLRLEDRLEGLGGVMQRRLTGGRRRATAANKATAAGRVAADGAGAASAVAVDGPAEVARARFVEGFVSSTLVFVIGPLAILGSLQDGLGEGISQLALKSTLDGFASLAFAASLGWGVAASALSVGVVQGLLTVLGALLGSLLPAAELAAVTATGGVLLLGVGLRLLAVKSVPVGDLLPALLVAPTLVAIIGVVH